MSQKPQAKDDPRGGEPAAGPRRRWIRGAAAAAAGAWIVFFLWLGWQLWTGLAERRALESWGVAAGQSLTWSGHVDGVRLDRAGDAELASLADLQLARVRQLQLTDSEFSAAGLRRLAEFPHLLELNLRGTPLPEEAVETLIQLKSLEKLDITRSGLPFPAKKRLQDALPEARLVD